VLKRILIYFCVLNLMAVLIAGEEDKFKDSVDITMYLKVQEGKEKKPVGSARLQYNWNGTWCDFDEVKQSKDSFETLGDEAGEFKGKQVNLAAKVRVPKWRDYYAYFRIAKKDYHSKGFKIYLKKLKKSNRYFAEVDIKQHLYVSCGLFLNIRNFSDKSPLEGCRLQYSWEHEWHDIKAVSGTKGPAVPLSNAAFVTLGDDAGKYKGKEANYACSIKIPFGKRKQRHINVRVFREKFESYYFTVHCRNPKDKLEDFRTVVLKAHGLVGDWQFNEGSGSKAKDIAGKTNAGDIQGASWVKDGKHTALSFDGEDAVVDCGRHHLYETNEGITVLLWIKPAEKVTTMQGLVGRAWLNPYGFSTYSDNGLRLSVFAEGKGFINLAKKEIIKPGEWNMVGFSFNGDESMKIFFNGNKAAKGSTGHRIYVPSGQRLSIGYFDGLAHFKGLIRGVRMYNYEVSEEEIRKIYEKEK